MSFISEYITNIKSMGQKVLSIFITAGFPGKKDFSEYSLKVLEAGADMIEIGIPFSDPLADGPVIQKTSKNAIDEGVNLDYLFEEVSFLRKYTDKPLILMGYANTILQFGKQRFGNLCREREINGLIIPDIPPEEYGFFTDDFSGIDKIFLTTPNNQAERIRKIDSLSSGFVYCVSVTGTTGERKKFKTKTIEAVKKTYKNMKKNPMLVGFGISGPGPVRVLKSHCDGFIMGSAVLHTHIAKGEKASLELVRSVKKEFK